MKKQTKLYQKWWFWVCIVLIVFVIGLVIVLTANKNTPTSTTYTNNGIFNNKPTKENIVIEKLAVTNNKEDLIFKIKNNNTSKVVIDEISAIFKDENGNFLKKADCSDSNIPLNAGQETISHIWDWGEDLSQYSNVEFTFRINDDTSGMYPANLYICDNFEVNANNTEKQIAVTVKNNNSDICSVQLNVVYYKNNQIVGYMSEIISDIQPNSQGYGNLAYPTNDNGNNISFDDYKVNFIKGKRH